MKPIVVIGGGPAGAVASSYLALRGYEVVVLEKEAAPRFVIGESLLPYCMEMLEESGLLSFVMDKGFQRKSGASFYRKGQYCNFNFGEQFTPSWSWTWQVQRQVFDQALIDGAQTNGAKLLMGCEVTAVDFSDGKRLVTYRDSSGDETVLDAAFVIDASGYGRVLPRLLDLGRPSVQKTRGAILCHLRDPQREIKELDDIHIYPFDGYASWIWLIPFADGTSSVGIVSDNEVTRQRMADGFRGFKELVRDFPELKGRFADLDFVREPAAILGYSVGVTRMFGPGYVLCGNSTEFLDPVFSSGVTLAAASGLGSAKLVEAELSGQEVDWQRSYEDKMQEGIEVFRSYVDGWYNGDLQEIFFNHEIAQNIKDQICSVLAGHVWDRSNPFVKKHKTILSALAKVIVIRNRGRERQN